MPEATLNRIIEFKNNFARQRAREVVDVPGGFAVLDREFPSSYDHNKLILTSLARPATAMATADHVLGSAGLAHRMVVVNDHESGLAAARSFVAAAYRHETSIFMRYAGAPPDRPVHPTIHVDSVGWQDLRKSDRAAWRQLLPDAPGPVIEQLSDRRETTLRGADAVVFLAVRDETGEIVSRADLYLDHGVAQIEDVTTLEEHRGRGYAQALLAEGLRRARAAGADLFFLEADANDWPRHLYAKLGYQGVGQTHTFTRP